MFLFKTDFKLLSSKLLVSLLPLLKNIIIKTKVKGVNLVSILEVLLDRLLGLIKEHDNLT
jgi:hypothetical protein